MILIQGCLRNLSRTVMLQPRMSSPPCWARFGCALPESTSTLALVLREGASAPFARLAPAVSQLQSPGSAVVQYGPLGPPRSPLQPLRNSRPESHTARAVH